MTEEEKKKQSGTVEYVPTYGQFAAAQNAGNAASNIASGIMPMTYARGGAYTPTAATPAVVKYNLDEPGGTTPGTTPETLPTTKYTDNVDGLTVRQMIEEQRKASYADAEKLRERSVIDASTAYAQNKATYGANAEALAGMGLTGGGYGDYLNSRAYAQQREEIQAARAGEAAAKREADRVYYADMMAQKEKEDAAAKAEADKSNAAFIDLLAQAKTGNYTAEDIKNMAAKAGITNQADIDALTSAATTAQSNVETDKSNKQNAAYADGLAMAESGDYSEATIEAWAKGKGITDQTMIDALKNAANVAAQKKQSDEEKAVADNQNLAYAQLRGDVRAGKYTTADIYSVAKAMGITDETMLMNLTELANEVERKGEDTNFAEVLLKVQSGDYNAQAIEALAKAYGITDEEQINELLAAGKDARSENQKNVLSSSIYADTTDEEIDKMVADGELDKENVQAAKDTRTEAAADEISAAVDSEDYETADKLVEKYYKSGSYSTDGRQNYYMEKLTSGIEYAAQNGDISAETVKAHEQALEKAKNEGKISQADYDAAKKYLYETVTTVVDSGNVNLEWKSGGIGYKNFDITINGETVKMASPSDKPVEKEISNVLDMVTNNSPSEGTFAIYDDGLYVYLDSHGHSGWYKASRNVFNEGIVSSLANKRIYDIIKNDIKPKTASPTRPEHKAAK